MKIRTQMISFAQMLLLGAFFAISQAQAAESVRLKLLGIYTNSSALDIVTNGDRAYLASGSAGVSILDIADPTQPLLLGRMTNMSYALSVDYWSNHVFVANSGSANWLYNVDVSIPSQPRIAGKAYESTSSRYSNGRDVKVVNGIAYWAGTYNSYSSIYEFRALDLASVISPTLMGGANFGSSEHSVSVEVSGTNAYVLTTSGLRIYDVSSPKSPKYQSLLPLQGTKRAVAVSGSYAYLAMESAGLVVIDVSNRTKPVAVGYQLTRGQARDVKVIGNFAVVAATSGGVEIFDINNPHQPVSVGYSAEASGAIALTVRGSTVYVGTYSGMKIFTLEYSASHAPRVSSPGARMRVAAGTEAHFRVTADGAEPMNFQWFRGDKPIAGATSRELRIVEPIPADSGSYRVAVSNAHGSTTNEAYELSVLPTLNLRELGAWTGGNSYDVKVDNGRAYVANGNTVNIVGVANPANAQTLGSSSANHAAYRLDYWSNHVFVAEGTTSTARPYMSIVDVSIPPLPNLVSSLRESSSSRLSAGRDVMVRNGIAFWIGSQNAYSRVYELRVFDLGSVRSPTHKGSANFSSGEHGVGIHGEDNLLNIVTTKGLRTYELKNGISPDYRSLLPIEGTKAGLWSTNGHVYLALDSSGLAVVSVTNAAKPIVVGWVPVPGAARAIKVHNQLAYVASGDKGLNIFNVSEPSDPVLIGSFDTPGLAQSLDIVDGKVYVADGSKGVRILEVSASSFAPTIELASSKVEFIAPGSVTLTATAREHVKLGRIEFLRDGKPVGTTHTQSPATHTERQLPAGSYIYTAKITDAAGGTATSASVKVDIQNPVLEAGFVSRVLPIGYIPGAAVKVVLSAKPAGSTVAYGIEEAPPSGWVVSEITDGGFYDSANGKVKWTFIDGIAREISYQATAPADSKGEQSFSGVANENGVSNSAVGGASAIEEATQHPADINPTDWRINLTEAIGYAAAYKKGQDWPISPNPIPLAHVICGFVIYKGGEHYTHDAQAGSAPVWWVAENAAPRFAGFQASSIKSVSRSLPKSYVPGGAVTVRIQAQPGAGTIAYGVEELVPVGWTVGQISDGGEFDEANRRVKWAFLDGGARALSYVIVAPSSASTAVSFSGIANFNGVTEMAIGGSKTVLFESAPAEGEVRIGPPTASSAGTCTFHISLSTGAFTEDDRSALKVFATSDFTNWVQVAGKLILVDGRFCFSDPEAGKVRFYRVIMK